MSNFFQNTSHSSFEGSHINNTAGDHTTNVAGDIYIAAVDNITQIIGSQDQIVSNGACGKSIFDEYHNFRRCDIRLLRELSTSEIDEETQLWWDRNPTQKKLKYTRTAHSVSLFGVPGDYSYCVAMYYSGRDAYAAWERDFLQYSNHHQNVVHLFGLSRQKSNPALVFCDDVVPLARVWEKCSSIVKCYLSIYLNLARWNFPESMGGTTFADASFMQGAVFVRRDTGMICFGSQSQGVMDSQLIARELGFTPGPFFWPDEPDKLLPFDLFHDETRTLDYFWGIPKKASLSQQNIAGSLLDMLSYPHYDLRREHMFPITLPSISLWTASDEDSFRTVGWHKKLDRSYSFMVSPWTAFPGKEGILLEHGWTRFHYDVTNWGKEFTSSVSLPRTLEKKLLSAWLCQGIFYDNATGGDTSDLEHYGVTTEVRIYLIPDIGTAVLHPNIIPQNIFMFIAPVSLIQFPESGSTEVSWGEHEENYYFWSFDLDGSTQISQRVCDLIGLPKYKVEIRPWAFSCLDYQSQAIQQVQKFFGYDPSTQDFAKACGLPLIEVISLSEDPGKSHDQSIEELDNWHIVHDNPDEALSSDSESTHDDTSAKPQGIWFPIPRFQQEMNLTVSEVPSYQDLDGSEQDSCSEDWSDLGSETSQFGSLSNVSIQYLEPSTWLEGYLIGNDGLSKSCRGVTSRDGTRFCWMFGLDFPDAGPPRYTERWICACCHYSHFWVQPVTCAKCGAWFGIQSLLPGDNIIVLKVIHKNHYVDI